MVRKCQHLCRQTHSCDALTSFIQLGYCIVDLARRHCDTTPSPDVERARSKIKGPSRSHLLLHEPLNVHPFAGVLPHGEPHGGVPVALVDKIEDLFVEDLVERALARVAHLSWHKSRFERKRHGRDAWA